MMELTVRFRDLITSLTCVCVCVCVCVKFACEGHVIRMISLFKALTN